MTVGNSFMYSAPLRWDVALVERINDNDKNLRPSHPLILEPPINNHTHAASVAALATVIEKKSSTQVTEHSQDEITALPATADAPKVEPKRRKFNLFRRSPAEVKEKKPRSSLAGLKKAMVAPLKILKLANRKKKPAAKRTRPIISAPMNFRHELSGGGGPKRNNRGSLINPNRTSTIHVLDDRGHEVLDTTNETEWEDVV
ncbi:hypothetical protein BDV96DRAFT_570677 [Lophiotrema nucula]|uniref:Uncharacterized protein n=1 Tax=Lophiotrema nucula TaxID=690887 RepID=A0A6A5ZH25_9PLEO|nr:hypothetical protein BDV96DRAFT_570677 [Lophiotrema nucula]